MRSTVLLFCLFAFAAYVSGLQYRLEAADESSMVPSSFLEAASDSDTDVDVDVEGEVESESESATELQVEAEHELVGGLESVAAAAAANVTWISFGDSEVNMTAPDVPCFVKAGVKVVALRTWTHGKLDTAFLRNAKYFSDKGVAVHLVFTNSEPGVSVETNLRTVLAAVNKEAKLKFAHFWLRVGGKGWATGVDAAVHKANHAKLVGLVAIADAALAAKKIPVGVYTSNNAWKWVMGKEQGAGDALLSHHLWLATKNATQIVKPKDYVKAKADGLIKSAAAPGALIQTFAQRRRRNAVAAAAPSKSGNTGQKNGAAVDPAVAAAAKAAKAAAAAEYERYKAFIAKAQVFKYDAKWSPIAIPQLQKEAPHDYIGKASGFNYGPMLCDYSAVEQATSVGLNADGSIVGSTPAKKKL